MKKENENYHKQPHQAQYYMENVKEKVMLVMILSGPWIEDDVGDIHDCEEDD